MNLVKSLKGKRLAIVQPVAMAFIFLDRIYVIQILAILHYSKVLPAGFPGVYVALGDNVCCNYLFHAVALPAFVPGRKNIWFIF